MAPLLNPSTNFEDLSLQPSYPNPQFLPMYLSSSIGTAGHRALSMYSYPYSQYKPMGHAPHPSFQAMNMGYNNMAPSYPYGYMVPPPAPNPFVAAPPVFKPDAQVSGGINSQLEYEPTDMSAFICWCVFGMLNQARNPNKEFESAVVSILYATRLPKSTIVIALEYLNQRFSSVALGHLQEDEILNTLVIALMLANKFNDDNTFTNRSWSGATGIDIKVLNSEEAAWLKAVNWQLSVVKFTDNIRTLEECWKTWLEKYSTQSTKPAYSATSSRKMYASPSMSSDGYCSSIPSSPTYQPSYSSGYSQMNSSPVRYQPDSYGWNSSGYSMRSQYMAPQQSIWAYTPNQYQYMPQPDPMMNGAAYFGYSNPYYACNMASC